MKKSLLFRLVPTAALVASLLPAFTQPYAAPAGYYDAANGLSGVALKNALNGIIDNHSVIDYSNADTALKVLDQDPQNSANVKLIYGGKTVSKGATSWNIEHLWPKSRGVEDTGADTSDLFHLRACDSNVNSVRGNKYFDTSSAADGSYASPAHSEAGSDTSTDSNSWEPAANEKGDVARALFYMATRYDGNDSGTTDLELVSSGITGSKMGKLSTLLEWNRLDPPDEAERRRNDLVYLQYQHNRNPFIDNPDYAELIWGTATPSSTPTPTSTRTTSQGEGLIFSEYIEGTSNNKALEIFNNTGETVDLSATGTKIETYVNGSSSASSIALTGTIAPGATFVIANTQAKAEILAKAQQTSGSLTFNGDDALVLRNSSNVLDSIGQVGTDPGTEWGTGDLSTADNTLRRKADVCQGDTNLSDAFDPATEWDGFATDTIDGLGTHTNNCTPIPTPTPGGPTPTPTATPVPATPGVFFSEYIEGTSNNKALEIFNTTGATVDLATGGFKVEIYANGAASPTTTINLTGSLANGDVFVLANPQANAAILAQADQTAASLTFNGDDAIVLRSTGILDSFGQVGTDPGTEWGTGDASSVDNTLRRKSAICQGDTNISDAFDPATEWDGLPTDTFDGLGAHTSSCTAGPTPTPTNTPEAPTPTPTNTPIGATYTIQGHTSRFLSGNQRKGIPGTTITRSGTGIVAVTSASDGTYAFPNLPAGTYTITPTKTGVTFDPPTMQVTVPTTGQTFSPNGRAKFRTYRISGRIVNGQNQGRPNLTVNLTGAKTATTMTDANGYFLFNNLGAGTFTVKPANQTGFAFSPAQKTVTLPTVGTLNSPNAGAFFTRSIVNTPKPASDSSRKF